MPGSGKLSSARRVVVKIGSSLLVDPRDGTIHRPWLDAMADDVAMLRAQGQEVVLVTSGAVALGRRYLGLGTGVLRLDEKQAAAAAGQIRLAHAYQESLARHDITVAQVLLTIDDSENRRRYLNARGTLVTLLRLGAVPVINENDTVATQEIRFGDNDRLAARVAEMVVADVLVLLSDIDGLYSHNPQTHADALFVPEVTELTPEIEAMAGAPLSGHGSGGMVTKLLAARICMGAGCRMVIAPGRAMNPLRALENGGRCTWFMPAAEPHTARKRWIAGALRPCGAVVVDDGAVTALQTGRSLLPAGVVAVDGMFQRGDAILIRDLAGRVVAKGLTAYSASDALRIMGRKTIDIEPILGYWYRDELVHRDDMALDP
ncbi:MAG: glutamate 5-kinase [Alphaproteobacteria bacterium]|nr:glutamate 5-kinase [Alphaproteobacteria bacterium]